MKPWEILGRTRTPDGTELTLARHPSEYLIAANGQTLMSSRTHGSEDALGACAGLGARTQTQPVVLVGGLCMGFTLRAALDVLPASAQVLVNEFLPAVVEWNRGPLGALAHHPLDDPRVRIEEADVAATLGASRGRFDVVLLDVDNGPAAFTVSTNAGLYGDRGVAMARAALRPGGVLAVWSASDDRPFARRLRAAGFSVRREPVRRRLKTGGARHTILVAQNGALPFAAPG
jgi:spermidine synthase